jgi:TPR repeat protein
MRRDLENSPKPHSMYEVSAPQPPKSVRMPPSPPKPAPAPAPAPAISTPRKSSESTQQPTLAKSTKANEKDETISSADSTSTLRPQTAGTQASSLTMTADDHVAKGIDLHEKGSLNESTYHLRIAAKQNDPTGMLLYALACRHGWGMRSNQQEGVRWLRKAVDSVGLEMLENPDAPGASKAKELQKAYRSQFALSIYELGVSYLNGWGIEQDKGLALRCFEIAGQWGDVDAMAEAGFCYAEGVGCKKDMKKAARFYRQAEDNGMSMVGNSW